MSQDLKGSLVGFCNPLLDISSVVDDSLLAKYKLKANDAILASPEHVPLFQELIDSWDAKFLPGGAGQNALRGAQLLLPADSAVFIGAVGSDENAQRLKGAADKAGLRTNYMVNEEKPTGTCALLITGPNRSMVANLSAAETYSVEHIKKPENWKNIEDAKFYYITGFFFTVSPETIERVAKHANENNKTFTMNLSAPFVPQFYKEKVAETLPYVDILFGNETEAAAFAQNFGIESDDVKKIAKAVADLPKVSSKPRLVVFTQGAESTVVASSDSDEVRVYPVTPVPAEEIGDSNGAGDAFVSAFLSQHILGRSVDECVEAGTWLGGLVVREIGPNFPDRKLEYVPSGSFVPEISKL
ncbi:adenosine kinase [Linderina macrospora]|uniref:Adenosine kinase n=1 Tax=Linderina macrospora TaxID=4868 RepID=A0ACC1JDV1_9FUNG|nr:adenosine kinase [Linderina macrospora]